MHQTRRHRLCNLVVVNLREGRQQHCPKDDALPDHVQHPLPSGEAREVHKQQVPAVIEPEAHHAHEQRVPCGGEGQTCGVVAVDGDLLASLLVTDAQQAGEMRSGKHGLVVRVHAPEVCQVGVDVGQAVIERHRDRCQGHVRAGSRHQGTQMTLDSFHVSGTDAAVKATSGVPRLKEILSVSKNIKTPTMKIYLGNLPWRTS
eukprot:373252-Hanusia_phi.AAC.1